MSRSIFLMSSLVLKIQLAGSVKQKMASSQLLHFDFMMFDTLWNPVLVPSFPGQI